MGASEDLTVTAILLVVCGVVIGTIFLVRRLLSTYKPSSGSSPSTAKFISTQTADGSELQIQTNAQQYCQVSSANQDLERNEGGRCEYETTFLNSDAGLATNGCIGATGSASSSSSSSNNNNRIQHSSPPTEKRPQIIPEVNGNQIPLQLKSPQAVEGEVVRVNGVCIQRALSCDSVLSDTEPTEEEQKIGQLEFGLQYNREKCELIVSVIQAKDLEKNEITGTVDSYVKVWLTPNDQGKVQTKVQRDSDCPQYMERFIFNVGGPEVDEQLIQFQVYSCDKYARHKLIGETELRLGDVDLNHPIRVWMNLHDMDQKPANFGDILFSMSYLPTAERLTIVIIKARNLKWPSTKVMGECCVKVHLLQNGKNAAKKKTSNKREDRNPVYNEAMTFAVPAATLQSVQLRLSAIAILPGGGSYPIGHVTVGSQVSGTELVHWTQTMASLRKPTTMWHSLRN